MGPIHLHGADVEPFHGLAQERLGGARAARPGTLDLTPGVYDSTMYAMASLLFLALVSTR